MKIIYCTTLFFFLHLTIFAQANISQSLSRLKTNEDDTAKMNDYTDVFTHYMYTNADSALFYAQAEYDYFRQKQNKAGQAKAINMLAVMDENQGRVDIAKKRYIDALELYTDVKDNKGISAMEGNIGEIEARKGNVEGAVEYFIKALKLSEEIKDTESIVGNYVKLGVANEQYNNLDKALEYYNKASEVQNKRPLSIMTLTLYNNIGIVYGKRGDYKTALENFNKAIDQGGDNPAYIALRVLSYMNAGIAYGHLENMGKAVENFNTALKIATDQNMPEAHARTLVNMASILFHSDPQKGLATLHEALDEAKKIDQKELQTDIYESLVDAYAERKDYKNAFYTLQQEQALNDSLFTIDKEKQIANLETVYDLEKSKANVQELKILTYKNTRDKNILIAVALIMVVFSIVLLFFYRKTRILNARLYKQQDNLKELNNVKDKLFSILGHDLRGPIANIPIMLQIYEDNHTTPEEKEYIFKQLKDHVQASTETLDKLLYWGQSQIKGSTLTQVDFETKEYIAKAMQLIKSAAGQKQITIADKTQSDLVVKAEPAHFDFVMRNLLSNAIKFTHSNGMVEIFADTNKLPGHIVYAVKDNGIGIDHEQQKTLFKPFGSSTSGTANEKGTSIGLMLCKEFIVVNGGNIWVESEKDKGATFYFSLKASKN